MFRLVRATIASLAAAAPLVTLAAMLADPGVALQGFAQHPLIAAGSLVLAMGSAVGLGIAIGRATSGDARLSGAAKAPRSQVAPVPAEARTDTMTRAETEFLANMSHELRTPLNAVIGFAELIQSEIHGPMGDRRYGDYVGNIRTCGEQLLAIIDATLDLAQLAAGQLDLRPSRVEPRTIVEDCARSVAAQADIAKIELVVHPTTAPAVTADPARLKQALTNLLSNAIKFTPPGGRISIGATGHDNAVAFEVTDTGIGMTPDQVDIALQPFHVIENCMTRRHGGVGLGLPLAQRLVRLHGGALRIESRPGHGTSVTAILPTSVSHSTEER